MNMLNSINSWVARTPTFGKGSFARAIGNGMTIGGSGGMLAGEVLKTVPHPGVQAIGHGLSTFSSLTAEVGFTTRVIIDPFLEYSSKLLKKIRP